MISIPIKWFEFSCWRDIWTDNEMAHTWKIYIPICQYKLRQFTQNHSIFFFMFLGRRNVCALYKNLCSQWIDDCWHVIYNNWKLKYQPKKWTIRRHYSKWYHFNFSFSYISYKCYNFRIWNRTLIKTIGKDQQLKFDYLCILLISLWFFVHDNFSQ